MRTPRDRRDRTQVELYPPRHECPACHQPLIERYPKQRWIIQLDQHVKVVSHFRECGNTHGERRAAVYRPYQEDTLAWRGYTLWTGCGRAYWGTTISRSHVDHEDARPTQERLEPRDLCQRGGLAVRSLSGVGHHGGPSRASAHRAGETLGWHRPRH